MERNHMSFVVYLVLIFSEDSEVKSVFNNKNTRAIYAGGRIELFLN